MKLTPWEPDLQTIVTRIDADDIDLQPEFQRQEIWPSPKKKRLIDTILRGWSIPPIHLVSTTDGKLDVLDGQQRLASIRGFFHDEFSIDGRITPPDQAVSSLHRKFYSQLDVATRRRIDRFPLRCFLLSDYLPDEPSELFYRLNQPTILTAGEQRNALYGPARATLKSLVGLFESFGNNVGTIGFSNLRLAYDDVIARLLYFIEAHDFGLKSTESRISERFRAREDFSSATIATCTTAVRLFSAARERAGGARLNKASVLSWLLFTSRFDDSTFDTNCIRAVADARGSRESLSHLGQAIALFDDRASLRVTDVSSVVLRDFALFYFYFHGVSKRLPALVPIEPLTIVLADRSRGRAGTFEDAVLRHIKVDDWSKLL